MHRRAVDAYRNEAVCPGADVRPRPLEMWATRPSGLHGPDQEPQNQKKSLFLNYQYFFTRETVGCTSILCGSRPDDRAPPPRTVDPVPPVHTEDRPLEDNRPSASSTLLWCSARCQRAPGRSSRGQTAFLYSVNSVTNEAN